MKAKALEYLEMKKYEEARVLLLELSVELPQDPEISFHCGESHDAQGMEREAIPFYKKALAQGIQGVKREMAFVQLGSSYRCIGEYGSAVEVLEEGLREFPENKAIQAFLAMSLYNEGQNQKAVSALLNLLTDTTSDEWIKRYARALKFYSENLDETW